jgi:hypothetical protein
MSFQSLSVEDRARAMKIAGYLTSAAAVLFQLPQFAKYAEPEALAVVVGRQYDEADRLAGVVLGLLEQNDRATFQRMFAPTRGTLKAYRWLLVGLLSIKLESGWVPRSGRQMPPRWSTVTESPRPTSPPRPTTPPPAPVYEEPEIQAEEPEDTTTGYVAKADVSTLDDEDLLGVVREAYMQYVAEVESPAEA